MVKICKRHKVIRAKINKNIQYEFKDAIHILKEAATTKFVESIDVAINLGINARKTEETVRGVVVLPHGRGKIIRVAVFAQDKNIIAAKDAGADIIGMNELAENIKNGKIDFDIVIASPDVMRFVSELGHILGPRGLMPNPKLGTVTTNIAEAVKNIKSGQITYRNDKSGIIHTSIGNINFSNVQIKENLEVLLESLIKAKPNQSKGIFLKKISLTTTMGPGLNINISSLDILAN
ncbi:MAG: 50S ribosomal protein L1 [Candidatus Dasytiphilus stammeri]